MNPHFVQHFYRINSFTNETPDQEVMKAFTAANWSEAEAREAIQYMKTGRVETKLPKPPGAKAVKETSSYSLNVPLYPKTKEELNIRKEKREKTSRGKTSISSVIFFIILIVLLGGSIYVYLNKDTIFSEGGKLHGVSQLLDQMAEYVGGKIDREK